MAQQKMIIRFIYKAPVAIIGIVGYVYAMFLIPQFNQDTSSITNSAFAILATMSALSFSFARAAEDEVRDRITFAGERFLHAAILVIVVSIVKYFIFLLYQIPEISNSSYGKPAIGYSIGILIAIIFSSGVLFAHTGLRVLNDLLLERYTRHSDWDDIV